MEESNKIRYASSSPISVTEEIESYWKELISLNVTLRKPQKNLFGESKPVQEVHARWSFGIIEIFSKKKNEVYSFSLKKVRLYIIGDLYDDQIGELFQRVYPSDYEKAVTIGSTIEVTNGTRHRIDGKLKVGGPGYDTELNASGEHSKGEKNIGENTGKTSFKGSFSHPFIAEGYQYWDMVSPPGEVLSGSYKGHITNAKSGKVSSLFSMLPSYWALEGPSKSKIQIILSKLYNRLRGIPCDPYLSILDVTKSGEIHTCYHEAKDE